MEKQATLAELQARVEQLEAWVLGTLDPISQERYQAGLEEAIRRHGLAPRTGGSGR